MQQPNYIAQKSPNISPSPCSNNMEQDGKINLKLTFPDGFSTRKLSKKFKESYSFVKDAQELSFQELLLEFQSMGDVTDINFERQYGAIKCEVISKQSLLASQNLRILNKKNNSSQKAEKKNQIIEQTEDEQELSPVQIPTLKMRGRLTSLEFEIESEQKLRNDLCLLQTQEQLFLKEDGFNQRNLCRQENTIENVIDEIQKFQYDSNPYDLWKPLAQGALITSLIVMGVKTAKYLLG